MSFSYGMGSNPQIDYPRFLIGDTVDLDHIFEDEEIVSAARIAGSVFQSGMRFSGTEGATVPTDRISPYRVAAICMKSLASTKSRLIVNKLLDVGVSPDKTAKAMLDQANDWLEMEDNSGAFAVIEQVHTSFGFIDRFRRELQRQNVL